MGHPEITLSAFSSYGNVRASWADAKGFQYHVWIDDNGTPQPAMRNGHTAGTIYKNAPKDHPARLKRCQYLNLGADAHAATRALLRVLATPKAIAAIKKEASEAEERKAQREHEARIGALRLHLIETQVLQSTWAGLPEADLLALEKAFRAYN